MAPGMKTNDRCSHRPYPDVEEIHDTMPSLFSEPVSTVLQRYRVRCSTCQFWWKRKMTCMLVVVRPLLHCPPWCQGGWCSLEGILPVPRVSLQWGLCPQDLLHWGHIRCYVKNPWSMLLYVLRITPQWKIMAAHKTPLSEILLSHGNNFLASASKKECGYNLWHNSSFILIFPASFRILCLVSCKTSLTPGKETLTMCGACHVLCYASLTCRQVYLFHWQPLHSLRQN